MPATSMTTRSSQRTSVIGVVSATRIGAVVGGVVPFAFPGEGHIIEGGRGLGQGTDGGPGSGVLGSREVLRGQPTQQLGPDSGVAQTGGEDLALGLDHRPGTHRRPEQTRPDPEVLELRGVLDQAPERGGDQRTRGSLGVAEPLPQVVQALLGLGQGGLESARTQGGVLPGVLSGLLDPGASDRDHVPGGGLQHPAGIHDMGLLRTKGAGKFGLAAGVAGVARMEVCRSTAVIAPWRVSC